MAATDMLALRCTALVKTYAQVTAVRGLHLDVYRGECFGLLGPNGAGKTTTVEILEGLTMPDSGTVEVLGQSWGQGHDHALRQRLGVQLQETELSEKLTVTETVRLFRSFYQHGQAIDAVLHLVALDEKRRARVGTLSGGQKQRLALACALVGTPEVLFLDEPTTGLDPQARLQLWDIIENFRAHGGTVFLTTHYMEEAARLCNRVAIMDHGQIIALDTPQGLIASLGAEQILAFRVLDQRPSWDSTKLSHLPGVSSVRAHDQGYALSVSQIGTALPALLAELDRQQVTLASLTTHQPSLEDVFVSLTGRMWRDG